MKVSNLKYRDKKAHTGTLPGKTLQGQKDGRQGEREGEEKRIRKFLRITKGILFPFLFM